MAKLWYRQPAVEWEEALPIGNGRLGAMVYGGVDGEQLQFNEESMWYGGAVNRINPDFAENLPKIREYIEKGEIGRAERLMDIAMSGCPDSMHSYQTLGTVSFIFENIADNAPKRNGKLGKLTVPPGVTGFERSLELDRALCCTRFADEKGQYRREYFASKPADCIIMRFTAEGQAEVTFNARLRRGKAFDGVKKLGGDGILLHGNLGRGGAEFAMALRAKVKGGSVKVVGEVLRVEGAREVTLVFTADTTWHYDGKDKDTYVRNYVEQKKSTPAKTWGESAGQTESCGEPSGQTESCGEPSGQTESCGEHSGQTGLCGEHSRQTGLCGKSSGQEYLCEELSELEQQEYLYQEALQAFLREKLQARFKKVMSRSYEELLQEHVEDYQGLYGRFAFTLESEDAENSQALPTDLRLQQAKEGKADVGLSGLLFDFGRYLTIACSRKGGLPSTLQGLWNKDFFPSWDSKYTININTEMNYWHVESCNLSQCHEPLFELLARVQRNGRIVARQMYGCRGFVAHHNTDIHGDAAPQDIWYPGSYWTMGGAWLSTHLWMHYQYTLDREFLKKAFPVLAEAALFFVDFLTEKDGYLVTNPSVSPENSYILPNGEKGACCMGATMDNQILRELFNGCLGAWEALGGTAPEECVIEGVKSVEDLMKQIKECEKRLMPTRISGRGTIMEWMEDYKEAELGHRHISHLYGLYPAEQITVDGTPELAEAARKTLEYRLANGGGHTGWSRAWITNHYASLWDGEMAYSSIEKMLEMSIYPNLFDRHPPFQIDGNFGICAAMSRMLVQSSQDRVILLPALPGAWRSGKVRGLCLVGNAEIDLSWKDGKVSGCTIRAKSDYDTIVICGGKRQPVHIQAGESAELMF